MGFICFVGSVMFAALVINAVLWLLGRILYWLLPEKEVEYDLLTDEYRFYRWQQTMAERNKEGK